MSKHYAIGENIQHKTVTFNNSKVASVTFDKPFTLTPNIQVTLNDSGSAPVYKTEVTITDCKIRFLNKWTGTVDLLIIERNGI